MNPVEALGLKEIIFRLTIAVVVGGILGLNRELHGKSAGLRTHALVALGAAIVALLVLQGHGNLIEADANALSRIVQGTLTGIGFLGAGLILRNAEGHPTGLTTAATIWICAIIGLLCGLGYWTMNCCFNRAGAGCACFRTLHRACWNTLLQKRTAAHDQ